MAITPLPTPPSRQRPVEFSNEADAFLGALPTFGTEANALAVDVNNKQVTATEAADTATAKALAAATSASNALGSANQAATSAGEAATSAGEAATSALEAEYSAIQASKLNLGPKSTPPTTDNQGAPLMQGATYYDTVINKWKVWNGLNWAEGLSVEAGVASLNGLTGELTGFVTETASQTLSQKTLENPLITLNGTQGAAGNVPISQGTGLPPVWGIASEIKVIDRTSNVIITSDNRTNLINISSGTFTQTFNSANTLGNGWWCYLRNNGNGDITLLPNPPNTIDGLSSYVMYPGEMRLILSDGTNLHSIVIKSFYKVFTTSGNFIKPPGYTRFSGLLWGGGGAGGKSSTAILGGGGGGCAPIDYAPSQLSATTSVTIAASVTGSTTDVCAAGNNSTFANTTAYGATGFTAAGDGTTAGGAAFIQQLYYSPNYTYSGGKSSTETCAYFGGAGGGVYVGRSPTVFGGGGGGGIVSGVAQPIFGTTIFGGVGGAAADTTNGGAGTAPGGGGGSTKTGTKGGDGARGELRLWGVV